MTEVAGPAQPPGRRRQAFQWFSLFAVVAIPIAAIVGLATAPATCACTPVPTPDVASPVEGVVIAVDSAGLGQVRGFTLRTDGGFAVVFTLGTLENATEFSPSHLAEHQVSGEPVRVYFRLLDGEHEAYRLEDAPA
jgi:hypothetical protein